MRSFTIHEVVALSGLTRGQVDQLISRWGFGLYGRSVRGKAREFHPADVFNFITAGELSRVGVDMPTIRDVCITHNGMYAWDNNSDSPAEMYPGQGSLETVPVGHVASYFFWDGRLHRVLRQAGYTGTGAPAGHAALMIDASGIARRIADASSHERVA